MSLEHNYSPELDILSVDDTDRDYDRSVRRGNFVIDFDGEGEVRGVEVQNVSDMLGIDREQLNSITEVELSGTSDGDIEVVLRVKIDQQVNTLAAQITESQASA